MNRKSQALLVVAAALLFGAASAPSAFAYEGQVAQQVQISGPGTVDCPDTVTLTATVLDNEGKPIAGVEVTWSTGQTGVTDENGEHSISVDIASAQTISASVGEVSGQFVTGCVLAAIGLPRTDTAPAPGWPALIAVAWLVSATVLTVRLVARRR